jgi:hypothetical protein
LSASIEEILDAAAGVEAKLRFGVADGFVIRTELHEIDADAGADKRMPAAAFPGIELESPSSFGMNVPTSMPATTVPVAGTRSCAVAFAGVTTSAPSISKPTISNLI